ncbi:hypothetical protein [Hydrogenophaga sp.]|uniref:hypothetical protein n=1 Tax=Hydrogenophaga sp. TaxID=1904254 RepID=UPI00271D16DE|nr:hypothetical protein [Hydrogenophaga sp.]MDO8906757.1 hypothetical protein [Hydrogenophaga sp.]
MIELANAPKPKPLSDVKPPPLDGQTAVVPERNVPVAPARAPLRVQSKPLTSFGCRS